MIELQLPFDETYDNLPSITKAALDELWQRLKRVTRGEDVVLNVQSDRQLEPLTFASFLNDVAESCEQVLASHPADHDPRIPLLDTCQKALYHFKGVQARVSNDTVLHHVVNERDIRKIVENAMGSATISDELGTDEGWDFFWDERLTDEDRLSYLRQIELFDDHKYMVWAYFNIMNAETGTDIDPLQHKNARECCYVLGLPREWYPVAANLWKIHYTLNIDIRRFVPTNVDANAKGWNSYFQPCSENRESAKWGWTRPLGAPRGTKGLPEVIHKAKVLATFYALPEEKGGF